MHEFLTAASKNYEIVIWSATGIKWIEEKMKLLGVSTQPLIWGIFEQYTCKNTNMFDDIQRNFIMNLKNGPFKQTHFIRDKDRELLHLSKYLNDLALHCGEFTKVNYRHWE